MSAAFAAPPPASPASKRELRAATVDELPPEAKAALAAPRRPATSTPEAAAQQAHIDPRTGTLIEAPPDAVAAASGAGEAAPQVDMSLQRFPNGFLYIDTSGYQHSAIATIGADGSVHLQCEEPGHGHDAPAEEPQP
ncbi:MAG TPA: hypothetical protein VLF18_00325 [Tahibacter sp.]|nr:hypothetical protein [Tahibacter sp.]